MKDPTTTFLRETASELLPAPNESGLTGPRCSTASSSAARSCRRGAGSVVWSRQMLMVIGWLRWRRCSSAGSTGVLCAAQGRPARCGARSRAAESGHRLRAAIRAVPFGCGGAFPVSTHEALGWLGAYRQRSSIRLPVHLTVQTGRHRQNVESQQVLELCREAARRQLETVGAGTHFAVIVDTPDHGFFMTQPQRFQKAVALIERQVGSRLAYVQAVARLPCCCSARSISRASGPGFRCTATGLRGRHAWHGCLSIGSANWPCARSCRGRLRLARYSGWARATRSDMVERGEPCATPGWLSFPSAIRMDILEHLAIALERLSRGSRCRSSGVFA